MPAPNKPTLLDERAAAAFIGMSASFLRAGRVHGIVGNQTPPPPHLKLGQRVLYDARDLEEWLADRRVNPAKRHKAAAA